MSGKIEHKFSWEEYGILIEDLWSDLEKKLKANSTKIDAIIVVLREGAFTAMPLAYKLNTYKVIPIQFKYMLYDGSNELKQIAKIPELLYKLPENPTFLLCDTFPAGGETKKLVIEEFKKSFPGAKFVMASLVEDKTCEQIKDILFSAFAIDVDENWETKYKMLADMGVKNILYTLLPWENEEEELAGPDHKEWKYN